MAFTNIQPINYGGGEWQNALASVIRGSSDSSSKVIGAIGNKLTQNKSELTKVAGSLPTEKMITTVGEQRYSNISKEFNDNVKNIVKQNKGIITSDVIDQVNTLKNITVASLQDLQSDEEYFLNANEEYNKNPDKYDPMDFENAKSMWMNGGRMKDEDGNPLRILTPRAVDPYLFAKAEKPPNSGTVKTIKTDNYTKKVINYATDEDRQRKFLYDYDSNEAFRKGVYNAYKVANEDIKNKYLAEAQIWKDEGKSVTENLEEDAMIAWGVDNISGKYWQDKPSEVIDNTTDKEKKPKEPDIDSFKTQKLNALGQEYNSFIDLSNKGKRKTANVILPDNAKEIKVGEEEVEKYEKRSLFGNYRGEKFVGTEMVPAIKISDPKEGGKPDDANKPTDYVVLGLDKDKGVILLTKKTDRRPPEGYNYENIVELPLENYKGLLDGLIDTESIKIGTKQSQQFIGVPNGGF